MTRPTPLKHKTKPKINSQQNQKQAATKVEHLPRVQPPFSPEDYEACEGVVRSHPGFRSAIARAGYDPDKVMIDPWSVGA